MLIEIPKNYKTTKGRIGDPIRYLTGKEGVSFPQWKNFRFADDVKRMLFRGRWIEQESFGTIIRKSKKESAR